MARALSVTDVLNKKYERINFEGEWLDAFAMPERTGVWFVWGGSGNGKTSFVMELIKCLASFCRVAFYSLEESDSDTMQLSYIRSGMEDVARRVLLIPEWESLEELEMRMNKRKSPDVYVIDSLQYAGINYTQYKGLKNRHRDKLIIFISQAYGKQPVGRSANSIMFDATLKIWVEGYRAISKGRYIGSNGGTYTIWTEGSSKYWGEAL